jgi:tetratricopeptide (TPR) repeat protein
MINNVKHSFTSKVKITTIYLILTLVALTCFQTLAYNQQEKSTFIRVFINNFDAKNRSFTEGFTTTLESKFQPLSIALEYVDEQQNSDLSISFYIDEMDRFEPKAISINVAFHREPKSLGSLSPILFSHFDSPLEINGLSPEDLEQTNLAMNMITGITLYSLDRCDIAMPFLQATLEMDDLPVSSVNIEQLYFYLGNCNLLLTDYETGANYLIQTFTQNDGVSTSVASITNFTWTMLQRHSDETWGNEFAVDTDWALQQVHNVVEYRLTTVSLDMQIDLLTRRAQLFALAFDYDAAIADLTRAVALDPSNPELYVLRGQIAILLYDWDRVLADYDTAIELDPEYAKAYFYRGILYYSLLDREKALSDFEFAIELSPESEFAEQAMMYIEAIRTELTALNN